MSEKYPMSVTFHGSDIVEVRASMVNFLADNVTPAAQAKTPQGKSPGKKPRKSAKKAKPTVPAETQGNGSEAPSVSADTDTAPETDQGDTQGNKSTDNITPEDHPNVSLAYNTALEQLMECYNGSPEGAYEVTLLLEQYRVASFREIPEDRGVELLEKANEVKATLDKPKAAEASA